MSRSFASRKIQGFTLIEVLGVVFIIAILIGLIFPVYAAVRRNARMVASLGQISQMSTAIQAYELDMGNIPGWFGEDELLSMSNFSSTENLVLSLMGGIRLDASWPSGHEKFNTAQTGSGSGNPPGAPSRWDDTVNLAIDVDGLTTGPVTFIANPKKSRQYGAFYAPKINELRDVEGELEENNMPEFLDVGSVGMPILYYRRVPGTVTKQPVTYNTAGGGHFYRAANRNYTEAPSLITYNGEGFQQASVTLLNSAAADNNLAAIVTNPANSDPSGGNFNDSANDVVRGRYVLIAPGPDGIFFDADQLGNRDINNYADLSRFDDQVVSGG